MLSVIKVRILRWVWKVARMEAMIELYQLFVGKYQGRDHMANLGIDEVI
jgi:hypothetical protein